MANERYGAVFRLGDFGITSNVALVQNKPTFIGEYVVPAGMLIQPGNGPYNSLEQAVGRIAATLKDTSGSPALLRGSLRLSVWSEDDRQLMTIDEFDIGRLDQSDYAKMQPFAQRGIAISEDKKFVLEIICLDSGKTLNVAASSLYMDVTKHRV